MHILRPFRDYVTALQQEHPSGLRVARNLKPLMCEETGHHDHRVDVWCSVCEVMICVQCALLKHRDHYIGMSYLPCPCDINSQCMGYNLSRHLGKDPNA